MLYEDIEATKKIIEKQVSNNKIFNFGIPFSEYQKVYATTNENINAYINPSFVQDKNDALTVLASGNHVFSLILNGF